MSETKCSESDLNVLSCSACGGNDADIPCAYPSENIGGCLRDERLKTALTNGIKMVNKTIEQLRKDRIVTDEMLHRRFDI